MAAVESPELDDFQSAFGTQCRLAAQALAEGHSREAVRIAFTGYGDNIALAALRLNRPVINAMAARARRTMNCAGLTVERANAILIGRMRMSRDAVEGEWGETQGQAGAETWKRLGLPIVNVDA